MENEQRPASRNSLVERLRECSAQGAARDELLKAIGEMKALGFPAPDAIVHWSDLMGEAADALAAIPSERGTSSCALCGRVDGLHFAHCKLYGRGSALITDTELRQMLSRSEMAAEVTLPIEKFRDLVLQAMRRA